VLIGINMLGVSPGLHTASVYLSFVARALQEKKGGVQVRVFGEPALAETLDGLPFTTIEESARGAGALCKEAGVDAVLSLATHPIARCPVPQALLAFDLRPWLESTQGGSWFGRSKGADPSVLQKSGSVVVPSEFLHKQLLEALQIPLDRVQVAPPGAAEALKAPEPPLLEEPYLLAVGTTDASRNTESLRHLFERLKGELPHALVVVGRPGDAEPEWPDRVLRIERVGWARLAALYQHASLYIHPAAYDGCGLAVLEAMAAGAPIACGRIGAIPELAGNVPYYFNAESVESMTGVVRRALAEDEGARQKRIQAGQRATAEFTWEATAWKVLHALQRLG